MVVDGFISTVSALLLVRFKSRRSRLDAFLGISRLNMVMRLLEELKAIPLLKLNLRLGEGSGQELHWGLIKLACRLHNEMATFAEAAVIGKKV